MKKISAAIGIVATVLAAVVSWQLVEKPYMPREEVQKISDRATENAINYAITRKESLEGQLLRNRIEQRVYTEDGESIPEPYLVQEQMFKQQIDRAQSKLDRLEGK